MVVTFAFDAVALRLAVEQTPMGKGQGARYGTERARKR